MKTITKIILILVLNSNNIQSISAQNRVYNNSSLFFESDLEHFAKSGNYAKDTENEREQYLGLWRYETATTLFEVKIEKADKYIFIRGDIDNIRYFFADAVIFKYRLVENGIPIYNNLDDNLSFSLSRNNTTAYALKLGWRDYLGGRFLDYTRNVFSLVEIKKLNTVPEKISFDMSRNIYNKLNPPAFYTDTSINLFNVPVGLIEMVKVY